MLWFISWLVAGCLLSDLFQDGGALFVDCFLFLRLRDRQLHGHLLLLSLRHVEQVPDGLLLGTERERVNRFDAVILQPYGDMNYTGRTGVTSLKKAVVKLPPSMAMSPSILFWLAFLRMFSSTVRSLISLSERRNMVNKVGLKMVHKQSFPYSVRNVTILCFVN